VEFLDGEGRIADGVRYMPTPGHTPGSYALVLDTDKHGRVVVAGDAIKYAKELIAGRCDMAFDTPEAGADSIARIAQMADRIVPGHFPELIREGEKFVWDEAAEFSLLMR
jgi:glyoxylase-like metal-dependent hydrolase (beta-lactamase superfamily II)